MSEEYKKNKNLSIKIRNLSVLFNSREVVNVSRLNFYKGVINVIIGRSGSGKTTFLRSINRLNEEFSGCKTSGSVLVKLSDKWLNIYEDNILLKDIRQKIGMVFQSPNILPTTIEKNLAIPMSLVLNLSKKEIKNKIIESLLTVHLFDEVKDRLKEPAKNLSGGQQQRLCLARALSLNPEILLLDEPTASLDFQSSRKIENLLVELKNKYTIIVVSHSLTQAQRIGDRIIVFKQGDVSKIINREELTNHEVFEGLIEDVF